MPGCMRNYALQEVARGVRVCNRPPVVDDDVKEREDNNERPTGPLGLEPNSNHRTGAEAEHAHYRASDAPCPLEDKAEEEEDEEDATGKQEVLPAVVLAERGQTGKACVARDHAFREDHEETTDDREIAQEEVEVEDETVAEALSNHDTDKTGDREFGVAFCDDRARRRHHDLESKNIVGLTRQMEA